MCVVGNRILRIFLVVLPFPLLILLLMNYAGIHMYLLTHRTNIDSLSPLDVREYIAQRNQESQVKYPMLEFDLSNGHGKNYTNVFNFTVIIAILAYNKTENLHYLIESLHKVKGIHEALIIFSHSYISDDILQAMEGVDFCPSLQIFYPYSVQLYPTDFPGYTKDDICSKSNTCKQSQGQRNALQCQNKHHWFWTLNQIFSHLDITKWFTGPVIILTEEVIVVEDTLHVLKELIHMKETSCPGCDVYALGYPRYNQTSLGHGPVTSHRACVTEWRPLDHAIGMVLTKATWHSLASYASNFCTFDDPFWEWTLYNISLTFLPQRLKVMVTMAPRVLHHLGNCSGECILSKQVAQVGVLLNSIKEWLYPSEIVVVDNYMPPDTVEYLYSHGGFSDPRDHALCQSFTDNATNSIQRYIPEDLQIKGNLS